MVVNVSVGTRRHEGGHDDAVDADELLRRGRPGRVRGPNVPAGLVSRVLDKATPSYAAVERLTLEQQGSNTGRWER